MMPGANLRVLTVELFVFIMDFNYQRAGTQYLLMASQTSVDEYSAANHMGEPGKLQICQ